MNDLSRAWDKRAGARIRKRRQALDLEQQDVAERVGVHVNSVQRWEAGTQSPARHLGKLEQVLGISLDAEPEPEPDLPPSLLAIARRRPPGEREIAEDVLRESLEALRAEMPAGPPEAEQSGPQRHAG